MRLRCPVSGREVEWDRFATFSGMLEMDEWPGKGHFSDVPADYPPPDAAEAAERYRMLVDQSPLSIAIHQDGRFVFVNEATAELLGASSRQELIGRAMIDIVHPDDREKILERVRSMSAGNTAPRTVERFLRLDGRVITAEVAACPIRYGGRLAFQVVAADITRRQLLEAELIQAQKMEALGTLAGGVAHDFNNILAAVSGYGELAHGLMPPESKSALYLDEVLKAADRAKGLVRQILAFSRKSEERRAPVEVGQLVRDTLSMLRATIPSSVTIVSEFERRSLVVKGNATEVQQIIANLVTNSFHAVRHSQGTVMVEVSRAVVDRAEPCPVGELRPGEYVSVTVSDNGPGIPEELLPRIFDPFFTTKRIGEGSGLGLSVVHGIVSSMEGAVQVRSTPGEGTLMRVFLPLSAETPQIPECGSLMPHSGLAPCRVLVVDDEEALATLGVSLLETLGHEATSAGSGREALELMAKDPEYFSLVISDQTMPGMSGLAFLRAVRESFPQVATILCTGFSEEVTEATLADAGVDFLLMKPFTREALGETVNKALAARREPLRAG